MDYDQDHWIVASHAKNGHHGITFDARHMVNDGLLQHRLAPQFAGDPTQPGNTARSSALARSSTTLQRIVRSSLSNFGLIM